MRCVLLLLAILVLPGSAIADEPAKQDQVGTDKPAKPYRVVSPKDNGIIATGINGRGEVIGFEWVDDKEYPGVLTQLPFYAKGKTQIALPLLAGYTATFPAAVSDTGLVVGRVSKPAPRGVRVHLRNQAFVWDEEGGIRGLGALKDDSASFACGVTSDGRCISGISVGDNRVRACVWERDGDGWKGTALPQAERLGSQTVVLSDDGRFAAGVDGRFPCLWSRGRAGEWTREVIGDGGSLVPRDVNNAGMVVGVRFSGDGLMHAVVWTREEGIKQLDKPKGYVRSEANAVNNNGVTVGMIDGPHGSIIGPNAFVHEKGRLRLLAEAGPDFTSAAAINDQGQVAGVLEREEAEPTPPQSAKDSERKPEPRN